MPSEWKALALIEYGKNNWVCSRNSLALVFWQFFCVLAESAVGERENAKIGAAVFLLLSLCRNGGRKLAIIPVGNM